MATKKIHKAKSIQEAKELPLQEDRQFIIQAYWSTQYSEEVWNAALEVSPNLNPAKKRAIEYVSIGPALPEGMIGSIAELQCYRKPETDKLIWALRSKPIPSPNPPKGVKKANEKIGGIAGLYSFMLNQNIFSKGQVARYGVDVSLKEESGWACKLIPVDIAKANPELKELGDEGQVEEIGYRFKSGTMGLEEFSVIYNHESKIYDLHFKARGALVIAENFSSPFVDELAQILISRVFYQL